MKKNRLILILIISFLLTGCTFNYDTKIMLDGSVKEKINTKTFGSEIFEEDSYNKDVLKKTTESYLKLSQIKAEEIAYNDDSVKVFVTNSYESIDDYSKNSKAIETIFNKLQVKNEKNKILLKTINSDYDFGISDYYGSTISISLPYKVLNHNANEFKSNTNTYLWKLDSEFKGIELEYQKNKFYTYNVIKLFNYATINTYIILIVSILLVIFGIIIFIYYYKAIKSMNL